MKTWNRASRGKHSGRWWRLTAAGSGSSSGLHESLEPARATLPPMAHPAALVGAAILLDAALAFIPASIAESKGRDHLIWWFYGFLLFLPALIHAAVLQPTSSAADETSRRDGFVKCPQCAEYIRPDARICRFCHSATPGSPHV
jgi:hypothetical protein